MARLRFFSICALVLGGGVISCAGILGFDRLHTDDGLVLEASVDDASDEAEAATTDGSSANSGACGLVGIPDPPPDAAQTTLAPVYVAVRTLDFGLYADGGAPTVPGFNLDRTCSFDVSTSSCTTNVLESTFDNAAKDKSAAGLDNAAFTLIQYINGLSNLLQSSTLNAAIADGRYGGVFRISNWNGQPDDDAVLVELFPALAFEPNDGGSSTPSFTVSDRWVLDDRFQVAPLIIGSQLVSTQSYVTGGQLVAHFKTLTIPIKLTDDPKPFDIIVEDAILQGTIATTNGLTSLSTTTIAGRWKTSDFLGQVRTIHIGNANGIVDKDLCNDDFNVQLIYGQVKANVCDARDIRSDSQDNMQLPCDAVSAALRLEGYAVDTLGDFDAGPVIAPRCTGDADVPANDDCTK